MTLHQIHDFPDMPRTRTITQSIPDHEVLLVFRDDVTAERFSDWLGSLGWPAFTGWHAQMQHDVEHHDPC